MKQIQLQYDVGCWGPQAKMNIDHIGRRNVRKTSFFFFIWNYINSLFNFVAIITVVITYILVFISIRAPAAAVKQYTYIAWRCNWI